jgi:hypothetical protein
MAKEVGIVFRAYDQVSKEVAKMDVSMGKFAKFGAAFMGGSYSLRYVGRALHEFFSDAITNSKEATTQLQALTNSWTESKRLIGQGIGGMMAPFYRDVNGILQGVNATIRNATELKSIFDKLKPSQQAEITSAYEQQTGEKFGYYDVKTATAGGGFSLASSLAASTRTTKQYTPPGDQIVAMNLMRDKLTSDQVNGVSQAQESARGRVVQLNEAMNSQLRVQQSLNNGNREAGQILAYQSALDEAYATDMETRNRKLQNYITSLHKLTQMRRDFAVDKYVEQLRDENEYLDKLREGRAAEAETIKTVNSFKRQGIELTREEIDEVARLTEENRQLSNHYGDNFAKGFGAGVREMQDELETAGDLGAKSARLLRDGFVEASTDALMRVKSLNDGVRELGTSMARTFIQFGLNQIVTTGMGGIGQMFKPTPRAGGGDIIPGRVYWAGEQGPEPFISDVPGRIVSNADARAALGGSPPNVVLQFANNGTAKAVSKSAPRWDGRQWIVSVFLDDLDHGGPISERLGQMA